MNRAMSCVVPQGCWLLATLLIKVSKCFPVDSHSDFFFLRKTKDVKKSPVRQSVETKHGACRVMSRKHASYVLLV